jgi:tetratricopeptide (TPR) repeat protein
MASVCDALKQYDQAFKLYKQILVHPQAEGDFELQTDVYYHLGNIHASRNETMKALNLYEKALENNPTHMPTLQAMVALHEKEGNFKAAAEVKERMASGLAGGEWVSFMMDLAQYYNEK